MLVPIVLILLSSVVNFGTCCCEQKERISSFLDAAIDLISKVKSENISCSEDFSKWKPLDCFDLYSKGFNKSGVYSIWPVNRLTFPKHVDVFCDMENGGWTVIQRRGNYRRAADFFNQDWENYKKGFGSLESDFWLGNDNIYAITNQKPYSIYFGLEDKQGNKAYAHYDTFWITDEQHKYTLNIAGYKGTAGDAMVNHNNMKFSTKDQDNDVRASENCAATYKSGWWFYDCYRANLNGVYYNQTKGIQWGTWNAECLPAAEIKLKPSVERTF